MLWSIHTVVHIPKLETSLLISEYQETDIFDLKDNFRQLLQPHRALMLGKDKKFRLGDGEK